MNNTNEIIKDIFKTIDDFYKEYKLPPMAVTEEEWNNYFDVIKTHFIDHGIMDQYEYALNILIRRAFYFSQMDIAEEFTMDYLKKALSDLIVYKIYSKEIEEMQEELNEKVKKYGEKK
jgi:hypothetical protein